MNDPYSRISQPLTDALLQLDRSISLAESNVAAAQQIGLPEASDLALRLPALTLRARQFLASVPDMGQPQRWGEARRLLDQARSFQPYFAPYLALGPRVTAHKQAIADQLARNKEAAEAARRARLEHEVTQSFDQARRRHSALRQTFADMQLQRGPGFDDPEWQDSVRSVGSILTAQDVRLAAASASLRDGEYDQAQAQLDQALGELQAALDLAQRARVAAGTRARSAAAARAAAHATVQMPGIDGMTVPIHLPLQQASSSAPIVPPPVIPPPAVATSLLLIEVRTGTLFRCDGRPTVIGRGLETLPPTPEYYLDLSRACDPGEAEYLGVSRRHAELQRQPAGFVVRDLNSTNGTRLRRAGVTVWQTLTPQQWVLLQEGDTLQFGLLECGVSLS